MCAKSLYKSTFELNAIAFDTLFKSQRSLLLPETEFYKNRADNLLIPHLKSGNTYRVTSIHGVVSSFWRGCKPPFCGLGSIAPLWGQRVALALFCSLYVFFTIKNALLLNCDVEGKKSALRKLNQADNNFLFLLPSKCICTKFEVYKLIKRRRQQQQQHRFKLFPLHKIITIIS